MSWHHVEDSEPYTTEPRKYADGTYHSEVHGFSIYRCGNCRALAVGNKGSQPSGGCMKCKSGVEAPKAGRR